MRFGLAVVCVVLFASTTAAQSTGSSFGGSDWSSSSSSSSDTSSGSDWSGTSDGPSGGELDPVGQMILRGFIGLLVLIFFGVLLRDHLRNQVTIRQVSIGVGPARRAKIQEQLRDVLKSCDPSKPLGRTLALR